MYTSITPYCVCTGQTFLLSSPFIYNSRTPLHPGIIIPDVTRYHTESLRPGHSHDDDHLNSTTLMSSPKDHIKFIAYTTITSGENENSIHRVGI